MEKQTVFFGGLPTEPDVKTLEALFPSGELTPGKFISYESLEQAISVSQKTHRFKTVVRRWRVRLERDFGIITGCRTGEGVVVLDDSAKLKLATDKMTSASRYSRRSVQVAARVNVANLDESQRAQITKLERRGAAIFAISAGKRDLELPQI